MHVALEPVDAEAGRVIERRDRVLGPELRAAAMGNHTEAVERQERHLMMTNTCSAL
jgi:hypothetical protein